MFFCIKSPGIYLPKDFLWLAQSNLRLTNKYYKTSQELQIKHFLYCKRTILSRFDINLQKLYTLYVTESFTRLIGITQGFKSSIIVNGMGYLFLLTKNLLIIKLQYTKELFLKLPKELTYKITSKSKQFTAFSQSKNALALLSTRLKRLQKLDVYTLKGIFASHLKKKKKIGKKPLY